MNKTQNNIFFLGKVYLCRPAVLELFVIQTGLELILNTGIKLKVYVTIPISLI